MADGNLGSLWMSLGIKESVSKELKRIADSMTGVDSTTKKTRESLLKLANTSMEGKDARWLDKMSKSLGEASVEAKELQAVLSSIKFDGKGKGWKKLTEDIDINNLNKYASLVNEIEKTLSRMESKTGLSGAGNDLMLTVHNVRFALSQLSEIKQELSQAGGLSLSAKGLENYRASLNSLFNEGASLLSSPVANFTKLDDWVNKFDKRITDIYDSVLNQSKSVSQSATVATDSLKKEEEQAKKTAEAVASIGEKRKPAVMKETQQEAAFNKDVSKMTTVNEAVGIKQKADEAKKAVVKLRYELNEVLNAFRGAASKNLGVGDAGEKGRQFVDILNQANRKMEELSKKEGGKEAATELKAMLKNAQEYKGLLDDIRKKYNEVSDIRRINPNVDTSKIKEALGLIEHFRNQLVQLESGRFLTGVDRANVLSNYKTEWKGTVGSVNGITRGLSSTNTLSDLKNKADKANSSLSEVGRNIEKLNRAIDFGKQKGYNTDNLFDNLAALRNRKAEFDRVLSKDTARLNDDAYMKGLYSETAKDIKLASDAMTHFGQVQQKVSEQEKAAAAEYDRRNAAEKQRQAAREAELKAMDAYAKRYMELVAARDKAMSSMKEAPGLRNDKGLQNISNEIDTLLNRLTKVREDITLYNQAIGNGTKESIAFGQQGLKEANAEAERLMSSIEKLQSVYDALRNSQAHVNDLIGNSFGQMRNRDVLAKMSDFYREEEIASAKKAAKDEAQAKRDVAKATREANAAEEQRQAELENSKRRIQSMEKALSNLQEKTFTSKMLGLDTSEAEAKINTLKEHIRQLYEIGGRLESKDMTAVGKLGNIGNGREVQAANDLSNSYDRANKEAQKGVEIEQKRQAEIAKSAAKVQADLVRGFERANSHAGKLNSTIQDLKSLFLQGGLVFGAQQFAMSIITTGGEMEKQHIALQSILGDMQNANTLFGQIKELALNSPFTFSELNRDVKQLAAYGVEYDQLYDTTKRLADMSSGLGVSFDRIALAFGQVQARGWLDGKELRQIAYAGIPLLNKLSEFYSKQEGRNVSTSEIKTRISNREVSFDDVKSIFWQMTDAGGQFYNMQQTLSETLLGRYNKLKDAWEIMLADFANGKNVIGSTFKDIIELATSLVQAIHTIGPAIVAAFSGPLLKKGLTALDGGLGRGILNSKANVASDVQRRILSGKNISPTEKKILQYKNQIRIEDIKTLAKANALNQVELRRLFISGQITKEMYKQGMALTKQTQQSKTLSLMGAFKNLFSGQGLKAAGGLLAGGLMSGVKSAFGFFGGLPGIAISAITSAWAYYEQKKAQLKQDMETTSDELKDRYTKASEFLRDNDVDKAIKKGDDTEIENLIDSYKEKLKEIAPEKSNAFEMGAAERKSNEDRLKYLKEQLELLKQVEQETKKRLSDEDTYSDFDDNLDGAKSVAEEYSKASAKINMINATQVDFSTFNAWSVKYQEEVKKMRDFITEQLGDISNDPKLQGQANQIFSSFFAKQGWDQDVSDQFRADVLNSMGVTTNFYEDKFKKALDDAVSNTYPWIADKIRNNQELTSAEKTQVTNLMKDAAAQVQKDYPMASNALKRMLAADRFQAVIHLVFDMEETDLERQAGSNTKMSGGDGYAYHRRNNLSKQIAKGAGNSRYKFRQDYSSSVSSAKKEFEETQSEFKRGLTTLDAYNAARQKYDDLKKGFREQFGINWVDSDGTKTGRKGHGRGGGRQEDTLLKELQERLSSLKSARQMYQKYKPYMSDDEAKRKTYKLFPNVVGLDLDNYANAVDAIIKNSKFSATTPERKKFLTSANREKAEWKWDEVDKPAYDVLASERNAYMDRLSSRWDLYKSLLEKTGNKKYAESAWIDEFRMDDKSKSLMSLYYQNHGKRFNLQDALNMSDEEAKKTFKEANEYNEWKKIVDLLRNNYVQYLQDGADAMQQTMSVAQKLDTITEKYSKKRKDAGANQDLIDRYNFLEKQEKSGVLFDQMKSEVNWDGVFGNLGNYTKKELRKVRKDINNLISGGLLNGMSTTDIKSIYDGLGKLNQTIDGEGFGGLSDLLKDLIDASAKYDEAVKDYNETVKKYGKDSWQAEQARKGMQQADQRRRGAQGTVNDKKLSNANKVFQLADMFRTLGSSDGSGSTLLQNAGSWTSSIMQMFGSDNDGKNNSQMVGSIVGMFAGLTEAIAQKGFGGFLSDAFEDIGGAVNSIFKDVLGINLGLGGADYSDYNDAKAEYDNLISVWDSLISKKTEYMNIHWGTEATEASKEAQAMLQAEIEQTKIIAQKRLSSGASMGSHSINYRMWKGSYDYNGQNWRDVAPEISSKYGVKFTEMSDLLDMNSDVLSKIKTDYTGLWANMDSDYRDYLEKLIEYGEKADDMAESLTEKLTGNKFSTLVESWGDAMASMANSSDNLVDNFENNLKKTILNSMIENIYGKKIKDLLEKTQKYAENGDKITDGSGNTISEYTGAEYADVKESADDLAKQIEATRDFLKKTYGWSDNSSSSSTNSVKGITEETADILVSYVNAIRLDCSVMRAEQAKFFPEMSEIAKSQLTQLNQIAQHTLRNAEAAERIEAIFTSYNDNFNRIINGTKVLHVK